MAPRNGGIVPCKNEACRYLTRTYRAPASQYPFPTRSRRSGGLCHVCYYATLPKTPAAPPRIKVDPDDPPHPDTIAAHKTFLAGRHAREARAARRMAATNPRSTR